MSTIKGEPERLLDVAHKKCHACKAVLPMTAFHLNRRCLDGRASECKPCTKKRRKQLYERVKDSDAYKSYHRRSQRLFALRHPEKTKAHEIARKVPRSNQCEQCGTTEKLHKHHPDYSKPKEIITLCVDCHERIHHAA